MRSMDRVVLKTVRSKFRSLSPALDERQRRLCRRGSRQKFIHHRPRTLATLLGPARYKRAYYHCPRCGASATPYDQAVDLGLAQQSVGLAR